MVLDFWTWRLCWFCGASEHTLEAWEVMGIYFLLSDFASFGTYIMEEGRGGKRSA